MPRAYLMSWEPAPAYRWVKMWKGTRYRVSCQELGAMVWTQEATGKLADAWWKRKLAELTGPSPLERAVGALTGDVERLKRDIERGQVARAALAAMPVVDAREAAAEITGVEADDQRQVEMLGRMSSRMGQEPVPTAASTFRSNAERFLAVVQGEVRPLSYREIRDFVRNLYDVPGILNGDMDVASIDERKVEAVYLWLKRLDVTPPTRKKRWGFFGRLVRFFWESRLLELPRNLATMKFKVQATAVKTFAAGQVRAVLAGLKPRLRLYAMLGLNCGMTSADMGQLRKNMVDLGAGRLVRKRVKTAAVAGVPTVDYALWPETVALLREHWSADSVLALTSEDGTPLWTASQDGDRTPTKDLIYQQFKRAKCGITVSEFRSISATAIYSHEFYGPYHEYFLGHTPKTVATKHYVAPSTALFDTVLEWLRVEILG